MAANKVFLREDNIIEIVVSGDQNVASIDIMGREAGVLLTRLRARNQPCLVLDDVQQLGQVDAEARKLVVDLGKHLDYDKLAMLGKGGPLRLGANLMLHAIGRADTMKYFDNREAAIQWLTQGVSSVPS